MELSKNETLFLKGIGILMVVIHNFFNHLESACYVNEFSFEYYNFVDFYSLTDYKNFVRVAFQFLGHYGVQVFIFLSGYGLAKQYQNKTISPQSFYRKRIFKLYPIFTVSIILLFFYLQDFSYEAAWDAFRRLSLTANWIPGKIFVLSGPWWFYSMIFQLYLLFPLFMGLHKKYPNILWMLLVGSFALTMVINPFFIAKDLNLHYNFLGNMPVFLLGILFVLKKDLKIHRWTWLVAFGLFIVGQYHEYVWYFTQLSFVILFFPISLKLYRALQNYKIMKPFVYIGSISMYIFVSHGYLRAPWIFFASSMDVEFYKYGFLMIHLLIVYAYSDFMMVPLDVFLKKYLSKQKLTLSSTTADQ